MVNKIHDNWNNNYRLPLDKAIEAGVPKLKCYIYKISVGGSEYIGFTSQEPNKRMEHHLESAKNDSHQKIHKELRRFGYIHDFEIVSEHENEIYGLIAEISNIKKFKPELNVSIGGEGNFYNVIEDKNHLGEKILYVEDKKSAKKITPYDSINSYKRVHYKKIINYFYSRYQKKEESFLTKTFFKNFSFSYISLLNYFFHDIKTRFGSDSDGDFGSENSFIIENFFFDFNKGIEIQYDEKKVRNFVLKKLKARYRQHEKFLKWSNKNSELFAFLNKNQFFLLFPTPGRNQISIHKGFSEYYFDMNNDIQRLFILKIGGSLTEFNNVEFHHYFLNKEKKPLNTMKIKTFRSTSEAKIYIREQSWFQEAIKSNIFRDTDAFYPITIESFLKTEVKCIKFLELI